MSKMTDFTGWRVISSATSWVMFCAVLALSTAAAFGQTFGEITGRLSDSTGASVPGATVTLTNISTNGIRTTVSTEAGGYSLPSVPPGFYNVKVEHQGFKAAVANKVEVQVQQTVRLDFALTVGQISESIEVQATADQLAQENATVGTVIGNRGIIELPLNGRTYLNLVALLRREFCRDIKRARCVRFDGSSMIQRGH